MAKGKVLQVRLSDAEMALVEKRAEDAWLKPSQWARRVVLGNSVSGEGVGADGVADTPVTVEGPKRAD